MTAVARQPAEPPRAAQAAHPRRADRGGAALHRRGQAQRAGPGDHPGRRRRDGLVLQPLRQQGGAVRRRASPRCSTCTARCSTQLTASLDDPAETFACSFRLTGRLFRRRPQESQVLLANGMTLLSSDSGLAPRALRDIEAGVARGPVHVEDPELALAVAGGALLGLGQAAAQRARPRRRRRRRHRHRRRAAAVRAARRRGSRDLSTTAARPGRFRPSRHCVRRSATVLICIRSVVAAFMCCHA